MTVEESQVYQEGEEETQEIINVEMVDTPSQDTRFGGLVLEPVMDSYP